MKDFLLLAIVLIIVVILLGLPSPFLPRVGVLDFRAYWSASYLLTHGGNFADPQQLIAVERRYTGWQENYAFMTWNPPWLLVLLAPYTLVSFERAAWSWILTNITLVLTSTWAIWSLSAAQPTARRFIWLPALIGFIYSPTLTAIAAGQVNTLVLAGLAGFLFFDSQANEVGAGSMLALTFVKPQLVYALLPVLVLESLVERRWRVVASIAVSLTILTTLVFILRPGFAAEYLAMLQGANLLNYQTPTIGGWLEMSFGWSWAKVAGVVIAPIGMILWWYHQRNLPTRTIVDAGLILSVLTVPFVWSYDFIVLLIPLMRIAGWIVDGVLFKFASIAIIMAIVLADAIIFYQRFTTDNEINFFWIPLFVGAIYIYISSRTRRQPTFA